MKTSTPLILALALSSALFATACNRDHDADDTTAATPPAAEPAPMPAEPAPTTEPAPATTPATPVDSGLSFAAMDKNGDGGISQDELADTEMLYQHFAEADTNGDGKLSSDEVDAHRASMAANPGG